MLARGERVTGEAPGPVGAGDAEPMIKSPRGRDSAAGIGRAGNGRGCLGGRGAVGHRRRGCSRRPGSGWTGRAFSECQVEAGRDGLCCRPGQSRWRSERNRGAARPCRRTTSFQRRRRSRCRPTALRKTSHCCCRQDRAEDVRTVWFNCWWTGPRRRWSAGYAMLTIVPEGAGLGSPNWLLRGSRVDAEKSRGRWERHGHVVVNVQAPVALADGRADRHAVLVDWTGARAGAVPGDHQVVGLGDVVVRQAVVGAVPETASG